MDDDGIASDIQVQLITHGLNIQAFEVSGLCRHY